MLSVCLDGIALCGPGLPDWDTGLAVLSDRAPYRAAPVMLPALDLLPPAERRRISSTIKLVLCVAQAAVKSAGLDPATLAMLFASSGGDGDTIHNILETLNTPAREVSPTKFHNSVHNAPSGYWALATGCREPSTTICAHDWTFGAALLEAAAQTVVDRNRVGLVVYDQAYPEPLNGARPIAGAFAIGLVLAPSPSPKSLARLDITPDAKGPQCQMRDAALETLRLGNPAARSLPLLAALARKASDAVSIENAPGATLSIAVTPL